MQINLFVLALVITIIHTLITFCLPVPGCPTGYLGPGGLDLNGTAKLCTGGSAGYIDRMLFGNHTYTSSGLKKLYHTSMNFDPEGLLSTFSSLLTVICGIRSAKYLIHQPNVTRRFQIWISFGFLKVIFFRFVSQLSTLIHTSFSPITLIHKIRPFVLAISES